MLSFLNLPVKIIGLLESNVSDKEIAFGVCLALFTGFTPLNGPMAVLFAIFFFFFKLNRVSMLMTLPLFKICYLAGGSILADKIGSYLLIDAGYLNGFWTFLTNLPIIAYLDLNNTIINGGIVISLILSVPVYFISKKIAAKLREKYFAKLKDSKFAKGVLGLKIIQKTISKVDTLRSKLNK